MAFWTEGHWLGCCFYLSGLQCSAVKGCCWNWGVCLLSTEDPSGHSTKPVKVQKAFWQHSQMLLWFFGVLCWGVGLNEPNWLFQLSIFCDNVQKLECHFFPYRILSIVLFKMQRNKFYCVLVLFTESESITAILFYWSTVADKTQKGTMFPGCHN